LEFQLFDRFRVTQHARDSLAGGSRIRRASTGRGRVCLSSHLRSANGWIPPVKLLGQDIGANAATAEEADLTAALLADTPGSASPEQLSTQLATEIETMGQGGTPATCLLVVGPSLEMLHALGLDPTSARGAAETAGVPERLRTRYLGQFDEVPAYNLRVPGTTDTVIALNLATTVLSPDLDEEPLITVSDLPWAGPAEVPRVAVNVVLPGPFSIQKPVAALQMSDFPQSL
jgi:hypothetical protein